MISSSVDLYCSFLLVVYITDFLCCLTYTPVGCISTMHFLVYINERRRIDRSYFGLPVINKRHKGEESESNKGKPEGERWPLKIKQSIWGYEGDCNDRVILFLAHLSIKCSW